MKNTFISETSSPFVSVIVPVYNDTHRIGKCIESLLQQTYPHDKYEVIIIDNGSTDETREIIKKYPVKLLIEDKIQSSYAARNKGIKNARGEVIAFTDSDCIPDSNWIEKGVNNLLQVPNCGLVAGKVNLFFKNPEKPTAVEIYESVNAFPQKAGIEKYRYGVTANLFTWRSVSENVGLFNDKLKSGGDIEWGGRVFSYGYKQVFAEDTCVAHPTRYSFSQLYKRTVRIVGGIDEWKGRNNFFIIGISKDMVKFIISFLALLVKVTFNMAPFKKLNESKQKIQYIFVFVFVGIVRILEKIRLKLGGKTKR